MNRMGGQGSVQDSDLESGDQYIAKLRFIYSDFEERVGRFNWGQRTSIGLKLGLVGGGYILVHSE